MTLQPGIFNLKPQNLCVLSSLALLAEFAVLENGLIFFFIMWYNSFVFNNYEIILIRINDKNTRKGLYPICKWDKAAPP